MIPIKDKLSEDYCYPLCNNSYTPFPGIIKNRWEILNINPNLKGIFKNQYIQTYWGPKNFRSMISSSNILDYEIIHRNPTIKSSKFSTPYNVAYWVFKCI